MGGDPIPGLHEPLVEGFEEWKATRPKVRLAPRRARARDYLHGKLNRKRELEETKDG